MTSDSRPSGRPPDPRPPDPHVSPSPPAAKTYAPPSGRPPDLSLPSSDTLKTQPTPKPATRKEFTLGDASALKADPLSLLIDSLIDYTATSLNTLQGGSDTNTLKFSATWTSIPPSLPITSPSPPPSSGPPLPDPDGDISRDFLLGSPSRAPFALAPLAPRLGLHNACA